MPFNRFTAYRNSDEFSNLDLHMRSRTAPLRNRRDLRIEHKSDVVQQKQSTEMTAIDKSGTDGQRNRRDAPECVSNYNADRHLLVGCSQPNIIEVKPQCNQEDEGMYGPEPSIKSNGDSLKISFCNENFSIQLSWNVDWKCNYIHGGDTRRFSAWCVHHLPAIGRLSS